MADEDLGTAKIGIEIDRSGIESGFKDAEKDAEKGAERVGEKAGAALNEALGDELEQTEKEAGKAGEKAGSAWSDGMLGALGKASLLVGGALAGIGWAATDIAGQSNEALRSIQDELGLTEDQASGLRDAALDIYEKGFGDSLGDVSDALIETRRQLKGLADEDLSAATENALKLSKVFDVEVGESTNAVNTLMTEFGLSSTEAFDLLAAGYQQGLDNSGDFLDSIGEYGPQFRQAGFSADQMFSLMKTGAQGGVLGIDKTADAIKEMQLRLNSGSDDIKAAFEAIGLNYDQIAASVAAGDATWGDYFDNIQDGLAGISDPIAQANAGVAIFGTQWEDATGKAILGMSATTTTMADLAGTTDGLNVKAGTLGEAFTTTWRGIQTDILLPIGERLLEIANIALPYVQQGLAMIGDLLSGEMSLGQFLAKIGEWIAGAWPAIEAGLGHLFSGMVAWVTENAPGWGQTLLQLADKLWQWIVEATPIVLEKLGDLTADLLRWVVDSLPGWGEALLALAGELWAWVVDVTPTVLEKLGDLAAGILAWVAQTALDIVPELLILAGKFLAWVVTDVIPWIGGELGKLWDAIVGWIGQTAQDLPGQILAIANAFLDWVEVSVIPFLAEKLGLIWEAISGWIGGVVEDALEAAGAIGQAILDGIGNVLSAGIDTVTAVVKQVINPIIDFINDVIGGVNSIATTLGFDPIPEVPRLAKGTSNWPGGPAIASEQGWEWAELPGIGAGLLTPGFYADLPAGSEVLDAGETVINLSGGQASAERTVYVNQQFDGSMTPAAAAEQAVRQFAEQLGITTYINQLTFQTGTT